MTSGILRGLTVIYTMVELIARHLTEKNIARQIITLIYVLYIYGGNATNSTNF